MGVMRFVYLATNDEFRPDLVKIGVADNVEERMRSLRGSGVPGHYEAKCVCKVHNAETVERKMHSLLQHVRVHNDREFFKMDWLFAAGILLTLALEEERENKAKPELAKWMRTELLDLTQHQADGESPPSINPVAPPSHSVPPTITEYGMTTEQKQRRDTFMEYVMNNTSSPNPQERVKKCERYFRKLSKELGISTVYDISDIRKAEEIQNKLSVRGELYDIDKASTAGGMRATIGHYVKFLKQIKQNK